MSNNQSVNYSTYSVDFCFFLFFLLILILILFLFRPYLRCPLIHALFTCYVLTHLLCFNSPILYQDPAPALAREAALLVEEQGLVGRKSPSHSPSPSPSPYRNQNITSNTNISTNSIPTTKNNNHTNNNNITTNSSIINSSSNINRSSSGVGDGSLSFLRADRARMDGRGLAKYLRSEYKVAHKEKDKDKGLENKDKGLDNKDKGSEKVPSKDKDVDQAAPVQTSQSNLSAPSRTSQSNLTAPSRTSQSNLTAPKPPSQISSQELLARALAKLQTSNKVRRSVLALRPVPPPPPPPTSQLLSQSQPSSQSSSKSQSSLPPPETLEGGVVEDRGDGESKGAAEGQGQGLVSQPRLGPGLTLEDRLRLSLEGLCGYRSDGDVEEGQEEQEDENEDENGDDETEEKEDDIHGESQALGLGLAHTQGLGLGQEGSLQVLKGSALWKRLARRRQPKGTNTTHPINTTY